MIKLHFISDEIQCQNEMLDLLPAIEEANQISITLDKKVMFKAIAVSAQARYKNDHFRNLYFEILILF